MVFGAQTGGVGGAAAGALGGCAVGAAASWLNIELYRDQVFIWYLVVNGRPSTDPSSWYKCTQFKVRAATSNHLNPWDVLSFKYPAGYPSIGGTVQPYAQKCTPYPG